MTVSNCLVFDLSDIRSIQIECAKCHAHSGFPPAEWKQFGSRCMNCGAAYFQEDSLEYQAVFAVKNGLMDLSRIAGGKFIFRFEVNASASRASSAKD